MTSAQMTSYRKRLLNLINRVESERCELAEEALQPCGGEASGGFSDVPVHPADLSAREFDDEQQLGMLENEEHILEEASAALVRIDRGAFGTCERCHKKISRERLDALPYARMCVGCARKDG
jgi:DnaK suppressor protein